MNFKKREKSCSGPGGCTAICGYSNCGTVDCPYDLEGANFSIMLKAPRAP